MSGRPAVAVVALGGGHGLAASLPALRHVTDELTAVVTVADDGGSRGRLRDEFGVLPPGDLRMALAALCGDDEWGQTWARRAAAPVRRRRRRCDGHALGNLLIVALWELLGDPVDGPRPGRPAARRPGPGAADGARCRSTSRPRSRGLDPDRPGRACARSAGRSQVATTPGAGRRGRARARPTRRPARRPWPPSASADWVVLGPGSWFTSVIPHLLVPELRRGARGDPRPGALLVLNLDPQTGETAGFSAGRHLEALAAHAPDLRLDVVLADPAGRRRRAGPGASSAPRLGAHAARRRRSGRRDRPRRARPAALRGRVCGTFWPPPRPAR